MSAINPFLSITIAQFGSLEIVLCSPQASLRASSLLRTGQTLSRLIVLPAASASHFANKWRSAVRVPKSSEVLDWPERRRLHPVYRTPTLDLMEKAFKHSRRPIDIRGPEEVHSGLIYRQYALQALDGGNLKYGHFEMIRMQVNKAMDERRMFAVWRVDSPWKSVTKRKAGQTLGGGKKAADHYVTPVKADRIIFELGGEMHWREAYRIIHTMAHNMPFPARFVSQEMLDEEERIKAFIDENNINPFTFEKCLEHNLLGCEQYASLYHYDWKKYYP